MLGEGSFEKGQGLESHGSGGRGARASARHPLRPRDGQPLTRDQLFEHARSIAAEHSVSVLGKGSKRLYQRFAQHVRQLEAAYAVLSEAAGSREFLTPGAEWLLDNYHIIQQQIQDIKKHFPRSYDKTLPKLTAGPLTGYPRVYHLAIEFLQNSDSVIGVEILTAFIQGYQTQTPLTIGEVWAVPIMLRFALIENLALLADRMLLMRGERKTAEGLIDDIIGDETQAGTQILLELASKLVERPDFLATGAPYLLRRLRERGRKASLTVQWLEERLREEGYEPDDVLRTEQYILAADQISIGNSFTSLKTINYIDWKDWFESVNRVHDILSRDPANIYLRSDFSSRDLYRRNVELLSHHSGESEVAVAEGAVSLAEQAQTRLLASGAADPVLLEKRSHVGFYLIDRGKFDLEQRLTYSPGPLRLLGRNILAHPFVYYSGAIGLLTAALWIELIWRAFEQRAGLFALVTLGFILAILCSEIAITIVQWFITRALPPQRLPKLDLERGIPDQLKTAVVVQTIVKDAETLVRGLESLEVRFLANNHPNLVWGILADLTDADSETVPSDEIIMERAKREVELLMARHEGSQFFVLFRRRKFNPSQGRYLAWERKRGKVEEFNQLLEGSNTTSFILDNFDRSILDGLKYVLTLDDDSQLPRGSVLKLIGTISHPLNSPIVGIAKGEKAIIEGYAIVQPRMSTSLMSAHASRFARICAGESGLDPYTHMVSEVYQDLFQEGTFIGKGIYDIRAFSVALAKRFPENALLSHDILEGNYAKCAVASDVELFDNFPARYHVHARRLHRWVRGDWQFLPWIFKTIPNEKRDFVPNGMTALGRWKLFDNLRRSLVSPALFLMILLAVAVLPDTIGIWIGVVMLVVVLPVYLNVAQAFLTPAKAQTFSTHIRGVGRDIVLFTERAGIFIAILPHQAYLMVHAIAVTLFRLFVSKRQLLEWEPAYVSERRLRSSVWHYVQEMFPGLALTIGAFLIVLFYAPEHFGVTAPFFLLWFSAPYIAKHLSDPIPEQEINANPADEEYLYEVALHTWRYFRQHMTAEHNYLIPDNVQLNPNHVVANRTSPTNISLSILSAISAYDCGFASLPFAIERVQRVFATLSRLERFRGHFLNWYNTRTLDPLLPRYVSMVDSGNLIGHLIATRSACKQFFRQPLITGRHLRHARRILHLIEKNLADSTAQSDILRRLTETSQHITESPRSVPELLSMLRQIRRLEDILPALAEGGGSNADRILDLNNELNDISNAIEFLFGVEVYERLGSLMKEAGLWDNTCEQIHATVSEIFGDSPWPSLALLDQIDDHLQRFASHAITVIEQQTGVDQIVDSAQQAGIVPEEKWQNLLNAAQELLGYARVSQETIGHYQEALNDLMEQCTEIINSIDFGFLYDSERKLFAIGYDVGNARRDGSYYDLLASEARLGSLVAVALGQVPQDHWFALGRPLADTPGGKALMAWGGTMFEYLMPNLMTKVYPNTILSGTFRAVVRAQQAYGTRRGVPWGVSESAYSGVDFEETYQYHAFGVPGLGLKRGLEEDLVISPYSTFLALPHSFRGSLSNLARLEQEGGRGEFGFYEAIDYTPSRLSANERSHVVQSFFAHHQGMSFVAINNVLHQGVFQERFHADQQIRATELLLQEKFPDRVSVIVPATAHLFPIEQTGSEGEVITTQSLSTPHTAIPITQLLSNGRYGVMLDNSGSGWSTYEREFSLTRWREDLSVNTYGTYLYLQDLDQGHLWSTTYQPTLVEPESYEVFFGPDKVEYKRRDFDIFLHTEITVSPEDDVEIRRVHITNLSGERRVLQLTSFGEVALAPTRADAAHPAFSKMFIESEIVPDLDALLFSRRPRSQHEQPMYFLHMVAQRIVWDRVQHESSRAEFLGRGRNLRHPQALDPSQKLTESTGYVLDPVFSLRTKVEIEPGQTETVTFISAASRDRDQILSLAWRYRELHHVSRAFEMAWSQASVELRNEQSAARQWLTFQKMGTALIFNVDKHRARGDVIARNRLAQPGLWRFGISGDFPICLVRITEPDQIKLAQDAIHAHHFLRLRGLIFELVILNEYPGGYLQNLQEELNYVIRSNPSGALVDKRGGVFLRTAQQLSDEEKDLLQTVSRVILSGLRGLLAQQVKLDDKPIEPVGFQRRIGSGRTPQAFATRYEESELRNGIGGFLDNGSTYVMVVDKKLPPLPWSNIVANSNFGFLVTERGAGYTWLGNCRENRITPWSNDPVGDPFGEAIYIRDAAKGLYWCPTPGPVPVQTGYLVEHKFGQSVFTAEVEDIQSRLTVGIMQNEPVKQWTLELKNVSDVNRRLELYYYVEWTLGVSRDDGARYVVSSFEKNLNALCATTYYSQDFAGKRYALTSTQPIETYTASRAEFIGTNRDLSCPLFLDSIAKHGSRTRSQHQKLSQRVGAGFDPCGVIKVVVEIPANTSTRVSFFLAEIPNGDAALQKVGRIREDVLAVGSRAGIPEPFRSITDTIKVRSPERSFDLLMNGWLLYQTYSGRLNARTGFYQSGGAFGFRDQLQDVIALLPIRPDLVRQQIVLHASRQFPEGDVQHWWHPPSGKGVRTRISDDFLWLPLVTARYIEATGDLNILEEDIAYLDGPKLGEHEMEAYIVPQPSETRGTLFHHCLAAIENGMKFGPHGLPLMGGGDWNDGMNEVGSQGKGESIWLGWFFLLVLKRFIPLASDRGLPELVQRWQEVSEKLRNALESSGWDGEWYRRAYFDDGTPLGSQLNEECRIDSIAQTWSVISGEGRPDRQRTALASASQHLVDEEHGLIKLLTPPFDKMNPHPGYIQGYLPGVRENGGQYSHAAAWMIIAYAMLGQGDEALKLFQLMNPIEHGDTPEKVQIYKGEPYVLCGDVYAAEPYSGRAGWSWYTGSAGWMFQAGFEHILGIKITQKGFTVNPCVPNSWGEFSIYYQRGDTVYRIQVHNPNKVSCGTTEISVNGQPVGDGWISFDQHRNENEVLVNVVMG